ncbi:hypothetical protein [Salimicrobium flavidum]|uniref:Uncharacterized protein n=1 Tax=Salimicrobium flavidum TaxID=570947 RepID=A0A1N7J2H3_9BACI|nr:hypothetical protein [Salimicrobium flavidum]SIS43543.1 hypothetical protein SAMN05421687_103248 [Salimicrobium flavidum]
MQYFLLGTVVGIAVCIVVNDGQRRYRGEDMIKIYTYKDLVSMKSELPKVVAEYIEGEFKFL